MDRNPGAPPLYAQLEQILKQQIECGTYKRRFSANRKRADGKVRAFACDSTPGDGESGTERLRTCTAWHRNRCCLRESRRADGRCHQFHGRNEKASYRNADNILQDGTDKSRGNGSKKSADSIDGAMLLPETCEECCGKTHGLYHYVSEKICELPTEPEPYMESLYQYLREEHGIYIESGRDTLEAALPSEEVQKALKIDAQMPIFIRTRQTFLKGGEVLNIRSAIIREIVISTRWNCKHMTCKKTKPDRSAKSARCESVETKMIGLIGAGNTPMDGRKLRKGKESK